MIFKYFLNSVSFLHSMMSRPDRANGFSRIAHLYITSFVTPVMIPSETSTLCILKRVAWIVPHAHSTGIYGQDLVVESVKTSLMLRYYSGFIGTSSLFSAMTIPAIIAVLRTFSVFGIVKVIFHLGFHCPLQKTLLQLSKHPAFAQQILRVLVVFQ